MLLAGLYWGSTYIIIKPRELSENVWQKIVSKSLILR